MAKKKEDPHVRAIREKLESEYTAEHRKARVTVYRYNSASVRVRIIDPDFAGMSKTDRDTAVWAILEALPEETRAEISFLLLLTPEEEKTSLMNLEFADSRPSPM